MPEAQHSAIPAYDASDEYRPEPVPPPALPAWLDGSLRIGIHTSIAGSLLDSLERARAIGCNALQIFSGSPRMWARVGGRIPPADAAEFRQKRAALGVGPLVIHDNYLINLATPEPMLRARSIQAFHDELVRAGELGADYLVAHPGSGRGASVKDSIEAIAQAIAQAARGLKLSGLRILLENTAGQGCAVGSRLDELRSILDTVPPELGIGVCLDTAHLFAAGYDIRTAEGLELTLEAVERELGCERVFVLHMNDSKAPLGSRVDRHEHIGRGRIGAAAFRRILRHPALAARSFIAETPMDRPGDDWRNVRALWRLAGAKAPPGSPRRDGFPLRRGARRRRIARRGRARTAKLRPGAARAAVARRKE